MASIQPFDVVFSCNICAKSISDIYHTPNSDKGFRSQNYESSSRLVTKLWLLSCGHLVCADHLEGGGKILSHPCYARRTLIRTRRAFPPSGRETPSRLPRLRQRRPRSCTQICLCGPGSQCRRLRPGHTKALLSAAAAPSERRG